MLFLSAKVTRKEGAINYYVNDCNVSFAASSPLRPL
nr:MAG TPA: hypothetical protein [Caudoviricetes sp.]